MDTDDAIRSDCSGVLLLPVQDGLHVLPGDRAAEPIETALPAGIERNAVPEPGYHRHRAVTAPDEKTFSARELAAASRPSPIGTAPGRPLVPSRDRRKGVRSAGVVERRAHPPDRRHSRGARRVRRRERGRFPPTAVYIKISLQNLDKNHNDYPSSAPTRDRSVPAVPDGRAAPSTPGARSVLLPLASSFGILKIGSLRRKPMETAGGLPSRRADGSRDTFAFQAALRPPPRLTLPPRAPTTPAKGDLADVAVRFGRAPRPAAYGPRVANRIPTARPPGRWGGSRSTSATRAGAPGAMKGLERPGPASPTSLDRGDATGSTGSINFDIYRSSFTTFAKGNAAGRRASLRRRPSVR